MIQYDSTDPFKIPTNAEAVAGYADGKFIWPAAGWARFPNARKRHIACVTLTTPSDTADVERYDLTPAQAPIWWHNMTAKGITGLWVYCSRSPQKTVEDALFHAGVPISGCSMWIATLDGTTTVARYRYPIAAVQYKDVGPYDLSEVFDVTATNVGEVTPPTWLTDINARQESFLATGGTLVAPIKAADLLAASRPTFVIGPVPPGEIWAVGATARHIGPEEWNNVWQKLPHPPVPIPVDAATLAEIKAGVAAGSFPTSLTFSGSVSGSGSLK